MFVLCARGEGSAPLQRVWLLQRLRREHGKASVCRHSGAVGGSLALRACVDEVATGDDDALLLTWEFKLK